MCSPREPELRELPSGDHVASFDLTVRDDGHDTDVVPISWHGAPVTVLDKLEPGGELIVTGRVRRRFFRAGGATQSRTEVVATAVVLDAARPSPSTRRSRPRWRRATNGSRSEPQRYARGMPDIASLLGDEAESLLGHTAKAIPRDELSLPGPDYIDRVFVDTDRSPGAPQPRCASRPRPARRARATSRSSPSTRASSTRAAASFAPNPAYFDPINIVKLAIEGGCNAVASTFGVLGIGVAPLRAQDPVHREDQPQRAAHLPEPVRPGAVRHGASRRTTWARPASARRSTSAPKSRRVSCRRSARRSPRRISSACSPCCGATCATPAFKKDGVDYHVAADLTGQANHLGVTIQADIIKQKPPENNGGYNALKLTARRQPARLRRADDRPPDRPHPLPGRELLHGPLRAHQLAAASRRARATSPRPCAPRSSTSAPAAWA